MQAKYNINIPDKKHSTYKDGFEDGFEYALKLVKKQSITEEDISNLAWRYSCKYLTDKKHPLCYFITKILKEQVKLDTLRNSKFFEIWLDKVLEFCEKLYKVEMFKNPSDRIEINKEELLKYIRGIDL